MSTLPNDSTKLQVLHQFLIEKKLDFHQKFPDIVSIYQNDLTNIEVEIAQNISALVADPYQSILENPQNEIGNKKLQRVMKATREEIETVFVKIQTLLTDSKQISDDELLYLEQQLSDFIGWEVGGSVAGISLPYTQGLAVSMSHIKRHPSDQLENHRTIHEAGFDNRRGEQGWLSVGNQLESDVVISEEFTCYLPLQYLEYLDDVSEKTSKFNKQKILIINPVIKKLAVASIVSAKIPFLSKYSVGLSPELSRSIGAWQPPSQGKIFFLLIDQSTKPISEGIIAYELEV